MYTDTCTVHGVLVSQLSHLLCQQINNTHQRDDGKFEDFCDGQTFKTHPLFSRNPNALQLMLYYDEVEITNPLGTKTGKHKLGMCLVTAMIYQVPTRPYPTTLIVQSL